MLGAALGSPVELLFVYEREPVYYHPEIAHWQERAQLARQHRDEASHYLDPAAAQLKAAGLSVTATFLEPHSETGVVPQDPAGDPVHHIIEIAHDQPNTLVVMCTHGRSGVGRWAMGRVADRVVRYAAGPVLVNRAG